MHDSVGQKYHEGSLKGKALQLEFGFSLLLWAALEYD